MIQQFPGGLLRREGGMFDVKKKKNEQRIEKTL